jgi:hypothetical protein
MQPVAGDRLHQHVDERLRIPRHAIVKGTAPLHLAAERIDAHHGGRLGSDLHEGFACSHRCAKYCRDADHSLTPYSRNFDNSAVFHYVRDRTHAAARKINFRHGLTVFMKYLSYF